MDTTNDHPQSQETSDPEDLKKLLTQAQEESEANLNGWKRSQADFENFKKRKEEENKELVAFAREVTITKMMPSLDTLTQMMRYAPHPDTENLPDKYAQWLKGVEATAKMIEASLEDLGITKIPALGKAFDPHLHEAVKEIEPTQKQASGTIVEELQTGYFLNGKVIRPSQVVITKV